MPSKNVGGFIKYGMYVPEAAIHKKLTFKGFLLPRDQPPCEILICMKHCSQIPHSVYDFFRDEAALTAY